MASSGGQSDIPYDHQSAGPDTERRLYRAVWSFVAWCLAVAAALVVGCHALYVISEARLRHEPVAIPMPTLRFEETDPALAFYVSTGLSDRCTADTGRSDWDDAGPTPSELCKASYLIAAGRHDELLQLLKQDIEFWRQNSHAGALKKVLLSQLQDAVARRDWATCAHYGTTALSILDMIDIPPDAVAPRDNNILLLASACEQPAHIFRQQAHFVVLLDHLAAGTHLSAGTPSVPEPLPSRTQLGAWRSYLEALTALRAREFSKATDGFSAATAQASGTLRELALLGQARSVFWRHMSNVSGGDFSPESRDTTARTLRSLLSLAKRPSFRTDIEHYLGEVLR